MVVTKYNYVIRIESLETGYTHRNVPVATLDSALDRIAELQGEGQLRFEHGLWTGVLPGYGPVAIQLYESHADSGFVVKDADLRSTGQTKSSSQFGKVR